MSLVTYLFAFEGVKSFFIFRKTLSFLTSEFCKILWERYEELEAVREKLFNLQVALEMLLRGFTLEPVDSECAEAEQFIIFDKYKKPLFAVHEKMNGN